MLKFESEVVPEALALIENPRKPSHQWRSKWSKPDLEYMILFKHGPTPADGDDKLYKMGKQQFQRAYEKYETRDDPDPASNQWTEEKEAELETLEHGEIEDIINDTALRNALKEI